MKLMLTICFFLVFCVITFAQRNSFIMNPANSLLSGMPKEELYAHEDFINGIIHYKKRKQVFRKMNYNLLLDQMQFITNKGDTVAIDHDVYFEFIVLDKDTFYLDHFYYRVYKEYDKIKLIYKTGLALASKSAGDSAARFHRIVNGMYLRGISPGDSIRLVKYEEYYMVDLRNKIYPLSADNLIKIYPHKRKSLQDYFYKNIASLTSRRDLEKLMDFLNNKNDN